MARLSHPNVVTVHDFGTEGNLVFIAMEFVDGGTLAERLGPGSSLEQTLELFLQAGRGLAAAHAAGLVHRDFKPANVLVGKDGRVRVSDLGLARFAPSAEPLETSAAPGALDASLGGGAGLVGTPAYMAPEQLRGEEADARSDQFAFSVALFHALYGARPFAGETREELAANVQAGRVREDLVRPELPGRLRRALLRGLSARPEDRFPCLEALLLELSPGPRVARRRWTLAGVAVLLVVGVLVAPLVMQRHRLALCGGAESRLAGVWDVDRKQSLEGAFLATGKPFAAQAWRSVASTLDGYVGRWTTMHREACEATRVRGERTEALLELQMVCLDERFQELSSLTQAFARADGDTVEHAVQAAGLLPELDACSNLTGLREMAMPSAPEVAHAAAELRAELAAARSLDDLGQYSAGLALVGPLAEEASALHYAPLEARAQLLLGQLRRGAGDFRGAESALNAAVRAALVGRDDEVACRAWTDLVRVVGHDLARPDEGVALASLAAASLAGHGGELKLSARLASNLGVALEAKGSFDEALTQHRRGLAIRESALGPEHWEVGSSLNDVGNVLLEKGLFAEALASYERARDIYEHAFGDHHPLVANAVDNMGIVLYELGRDEQAATRHAEALAIREAALGPDHPSVAGTLNNLGRTLRRLGRDDEAISAYERAISIFERSLGPDHPRVAMVLNNLGVVLELHGRYDEALAAHRRALGIREKALGPEHPSVAESLDNLAQLERALGHHRDALAHFERALAIDEKKLGPDHPYLADELTGMGLSLLALGDGVRALTTLERALRLRQAAPPTNLAQTRAALAKALWSTGRDRGRALALARDARDAFAASGDSESVRDLAEVRAWLLGKAAP